jgi:hypothetical protein
MKIIEDPTHSIKIERPVIHSELSWYDKNSFNKKLSIRPDITILNCNNIILYNKKNKFQIPSKGYSFDGDAINFEIKFIRRNSSFTKKIKEDIKKDKINSKNLFNRFIEGETKIWTYILIFIWSDQGIAQANNDETALDLLSDDEGFSFIIITKDD